MVARYAGIQRGDRRLLDGSGHCMLPRRQQFHASQFVIDECRQVSRALVPRPEVYSYRPV